MISNSADPLCVSPGEQVLIEGLCSSAWYRLLRRAFWIWQGAEPIEIEEILARIANSESKRTHEQLLDTVQGYLPGNWIYEWSQTAGQYQKLGKELARVGEQRRAKAAYLKATRYYSIASYPHLKGDELAEQAQLLANQAYREAGRLFKVPLKLIKVPFRGKEILGYLHLPVEDRPVPIVMVSGSIDSLQMDFYRFFKEYLKPLGIGMLSLDIPGIGYASQWPLVQDSSRLHQAVLHHIKDLPWVDSRRIGMVGFRLAGNIAARLAYLEPAHLKLAVCIGPGLNQYFMDPVLFNRSPHDAGQPGQPAGRGCGRLGQPADAVSGLLPQAAGAGGGDPDPGAHPQRGSQAGFHLPRVGYPHPGLLQSLRQSRGDGQAAHEGSI